MYKIRTMKGGYKGERMQVRSFRTADAMHKFLNDGDNALKWRQCVNQKETHPNRPEAVDETKLKSGKYAWAGGQWHNVKDLDPTVLAHI